MDVGLIEGEKKAPRFVREEYQIIRDQPAYDMITKYASPSDMQLIDGWSRSFYTIEGHMASILAYRKPLLPESNDPVWHETKADIIQEFQGFPKIQSLTFEHDLDLVKFESASAAGIGYTGRKGENNNLSKAKGVVNRAIRDLADRAKVIGYRQALDELPADSTPDIGLTRTQLAELPSIKVRNVFGEAFHYILIEGLSAYPLLTHFKRSDTFYFIGKDPTIEVPNILERMERLGNYFIALDWSNFDASVQNWEINFAFECLRSMLIFPTYLSEVAFDYSITLFKSRKIRAPDGQEYLRISGIPSGSYYTNLVGSIINYTRIKFLMKKLNIPVPLIKVQGDDSLTITPQSYPPDPNELSEIGAKFGWTLRPDKCIITPHAAAVVFLGRSSRLRYNTRDYLKALRLICFPEYEVDDPKISTARVHAISKDAGQSNPIFNMIYLAMYQTYGEAQDVPDKYLPYFEKEMYM